jgi:hypothetical protein
VAQRYLTRLTIKAIEGYGTSPSIHIQDNNGACIA